MPEAAHRQELQQSLHHLQLLPADSSRILSPSAAAQAP